MKKYLKIYQHKTHLAVTFAVILLPLFFIFFLTPLGKTEQSLFLDDLFTSTLRIAIAYALSLGIAVGLGLLFTRGRTGHIAIPLFDVLQSIPTFAILPLGVRFFGASDATVIFFLVITMVWPILFSIISSLKLSREDWEEAAEVYGARGWRRIVYFALPLTFPGVITGSIVGLADGWEVLVATEIILGPHARGLGGFFNEYAGSSQVVLFGVLTLLLFVFAINKLAWLPLLERSHKLLTD